MKRKKYISRISGAAGVALILAAFAVADLFISGVMAVAGLVLGWLSREFDAMERRS